MKKIIRKRINKQTFVPRNEHPQTEKEIFANLAKNEVYNEKRGGYYLPYNLLMDEDEKHIIDLSSFDQNGKHKVFPYIRLNKRWVRWALRHGYKYV